MELCFLCESVLKWRDIYFCSWDDYERRKGKCLHIYERSRLLDHFNVATDRGLLLEKWLHYSISTENHIIDIVLHKNPSIKKIY